MTFPIFAGTAARLLCLPIFLAGLASFNGQDPAEAKAQARFREIQTDIQGVVQNASARAGAPIHVDPYVHSAGMSHAAHKGAHPKGC